MTITSKGYPGGLPRAGWADAIQYAGAQYNVRNVDDYKLTIIPSGTDRGVSISAGVASGRGVTDTNDAPIVKQAATVGAGTRWDMVVLRRTFGTKVSTIEIIQGGSTPTLPSRNNDVLTAGIDDQPLWLIKVVSGHTVIQDKIDLRVWSAEGGATAANILALDYNMRPGARITIGKDVYDRVVASDSAGSAWVKTTPIPSALQAFGAGFPAGAQVLFQTETMPKVSNNFGVVTITFPTPFPNGILTVIPVSGDDAANPDATINTLTFDKNGFTYRVWKGTGASSYETRAVAAGTLHRITYMACGY